MQNHSKAIIEVLSALPDWVDYPPNPANWTPEQIESRFPIWTILPEAWRGRGMPFPLETGWCAYCNGHLIAWDPRGSVVFSVAPGSAGPYASTVAVIQSRVPTVQPPQGVIGSIERFAASYFGSGVKASIVRNEWMERKRIVANAIRTIEPMFAETRRLLTRHVGSSAALDAVMASEYLPNQIVDLAISALRPLLPQQPVAVVPHTPPPLAAEPKPAPRQRRVQKAIDDAGYDLLCEAWDKSDPTQRKRPTWRELAEGVRRMLGLTTKLSSTMTDLKSRSPRTREKWDAIGKEMALERAGRVALRRK